MRRTRSNFLPCSKREKSASGHSSLSCCRRWSLLVHLLFLFLFAILFLTVGAAPHFYKTTTQKLQFFCVDFWLRLFVLFFWRRFISLFVACFLVLVVRHRFYLLDDICHVVNVIIILTTINLTLLQQKLEEMKLEARAGVLLAENKIINLILTSSWSTSLALILFSDLNSAKIIFSSEYY